jgi:hypothetical protein
MATVITSLATVIPVVGKTVLSYLWGGSLRLPFKNLVICWDRDDIQISRIILNNSQRLNARDLIFTSLFTHKVKIQSKL